MLVAISTVRESDDSEGDKLIPWSLSLDSPRGELGSLSGSGLADRDE